jgi:hypothetical protein
MACSWLIEWGEICHKFNNIFESNLLTTVKRGINLTTLVYLARRPGAILMLNPISKDPISEKYAINSRTISLYHEGDMED